MQARRPSSPSTSPATAATRRPRTASGNQAVERPSPPPSRASGGRRQCQAPSSPPRPEPGPSHCSTRSRSSSTGSVARALDCLESTFVEFARRRRDHQREAASDSASLGEGAHSRFPGAVCRQRWTVRLGEVEPVFGQTGRVVLDITAAILVGILRDHLGRLRTGTGILTRDASTSRLIRPSADACAPRRSRRTRGRPTRTSRIGRQRIVTVSLPRRSGLKGGPSDMPFFAPGVGSVSLALDAARGSTTGCRPDRTRRRPATD